MKKNKIVNFLPYISVLIFLILAIPFSFKEYSQVEWIVKMYVLPVIIIIIFIIFTVQRLKKLDDNKFEILGNTIPVLLYISGALIYFVTVTTRTSELSIVNDLTIYLIILVITLSLAIILFFEELADKKKNVAIIFTIVNAVLIMCIVGYGIIFLPNIILSDSNMIPVDYEGLKLVSIISIVFGAILAIIFVLLFMFNKTNKKVQSLINENEDMKKYEEEYLLNMYEFSKQRLEELGYKFNDENINNEKIEKVVVEQKPKLPKEKKVITPTVEELAQFISDSFEDVNIVYAKNPANYKVFRKKKLMCIIQSTSNDYRVIFQRKPISVAKLLIKYPNTIVKSNSPQGEQWFKLVNKGNVDEEDIKVVIKFSHKYLVDEEARLLAKKEQQKAKLLAKKEKEKARLKEKREKEKARLKAKQEKEKQLLAKQQKLNKE